MTALSSIILFIANLSGMELLFLWALETVVMIFFVLNLQQLLKMIGEENRQIDPVILWISLIPMIGWLLQIYIVIKVSQSITLELQKRGMTIKEEHPGRSIGIAYCILMLLSSVPFIGLILLCFGLYLWVSYWIKMSDYKKLLK